MKDFWEIFWSVTPALLFAVLVACLVMTAPSIDQIVWGR